MKKTTRENLFLAVLAVLSAVAIGLSIHFGGALDDSSVTNVNQCTDGLALHYAADGSLYGDANLDGILSGTECDWR